MSVNINKNTNLFWNYDLRTNYLYGVEVRSLQSLCILNAVVNAFESDEVVEKIRRHSIDQGQDDINNLLTIVENKFGVEYLPKCFVIEVLLTIKLVYNEITRFLATILETDKSLFLKNFVFNWQGGINLYETVHKVLNCKTLSMRDKFEFSCKYLFDEHKIKNYFNVLTPNIQNSYSNPEISFGFFHCLIDYFIWGVRDSFQTHLANSEDTGDIKITSYKFFLSYLESNYCTVIGVQYLFEIDPPFDSYICEAIKSLLKHKSRDNKINISLYLIRQLEDIQLINSFAFDILSNLVRNSRLHDIFIFYFSILKNRVENKKYFLLIMTVVLEMYDMINLEYKDGKYFIILKDFIRLIPNWAKNYIKRKHAIYYAALVFSLFTYKDTELISPLLFIDVENNMDLGDNFYELATTFPDLFKYFYLFCFNRNDDDKNFLKKILKSEKQFSDVLSRVYMTSLNSRLTEARNRFWTVTLPFMKCYSNPLITTKNKRIKLQYLFLEKGEFARKSVTTSSLKALTKVEYSEEFLSFIINREQVLIFYKRRRVMKIVYNSDTCNKAFLCSNECNYSMFNQDLSFKRSINYRTLFLTLMCVFFLIYLKFFNKGNFN